MSLKCLIVDDEPLSLDILEKYIHDIPDIELAGRCLDAFEAMKMISEKQIDLVFLDINMPKLSGINMVRSVESMPDVIFTTAYPEYAVEGFELDVLDYLVKPISFERFVKAVNKALKKLKPAPEQAVDQSFLMVRVDKKMYKVLHSDILYVQSMGDFVKIHTQQKVYISGDTLKNIESQLPENRFVRIHKSYIISLDAFSFLEGNQIRIGETFLPVGQTYKNGLLRALDLKNRD